LPRSSSWSQRQNRDLYIPVGDVGFWQGAYRDTAQPGYDEARKVIEAREPWTVELLYGDHEGGQRVISRFTMLPIRDPNPAPDENPPAELRWLATASRHWNIDRPTRDDLPVPHRKSPARPGRLRTGFAGLPLVLSHPVHHN
jgi:hypothetical protein